jgi:dTDP-4-amino-4,6-dideoxygalactose transaminase
LEKRSNTLNKIHLFKPYIPKNDILTALNDTLSTRWIGEGPKVKEFEEMFSEIFNLSNCLSVNSCTSGLELSYDVLGLKEGDEVITPVLTCTATNHPLKRKGCNIKFADIDPKTMNVSRETIAPLVTDKTKLIIVVHLGGEAVDVHSIKEAFPNIDIVEDCAQSIGAVYPKVGS